MEFTQIKFNWYIFRFGIVVQVGNIPNGLVFVGDPDPVLGGTVPRGGGAPNKNNFAPRVGFAYSFDGDGDGVFVKFLGDNRTVISGAFGLYYGAVIGDTVLQQLTASGYRRTNAFFNPFASASSPILFP